MTGIPRGTVRDWVSPQYLRLSDSRPGCFRCDPRQVVEPDGYAYLLGLYLGDGYLVAHPRAWQLRIFQDSRYVDLVERCMDVMAAVSQRRVSLVARIGCLEIGAYWKHWIHLFPQHGRGPKHRRLIQLEPWQQEIVSSHPRPFLAGLIHSDGCRVINKITRKGSQGRLHHYAYPRYQFTNASDDIRRLFIETCDVLGLRWTQMNARHVAVSRSTDVAFLDSFIGPKS